MRKVSHAVMEWHRDQTAIHIRDASFKISSMELELPHMAEVGTRANIRTAKSMESRRITGKKILLF